MKVAWVLLLTLVLGMIAWERLKIEQDWNQPRYFVTGRHQLLPGGVLDESVITEGSVASPFVWDWSAMHSDQTKQEAIINAQTIYVRVGTYGQTITVKSVNLQIQFSEQSGVTCKSLGTVTLKDNSWVSFGDLKCEPIALTGLKPLTASLRFAPSSQQTSDADQKVAIYHFEDSTAAINIGVPSLYGAKDAPPVTLAQAMNYGDVWNSTFRSAALMLALLVGGLSTVVLMVSFFREQKSAAIWCFFGLWSALALYQVLSNPPFQDPDEAMLLSGIAHEMMPSDIFARKGELVGVVTRTQYMCEDFAAKAPILPEKKCNFRYLDFEGWSSPTQRSVLYGKIMHPMAGLVERHLLILSANISLYMGHYFKLIFLLMSVLFSSALIWLLLVSSRSVSAAAYLVIISIPVVLSYSTAVTNYSWGIFVGAAFCVLLIEEGRLRYLWLSVAPWFGLLSVAFANSQTPFAVLIPVLLSLFCWVHRDSSSVSRYHASLLVALLSCIAAVIVVRLVSGVSLVTEQIMLSKALELASQAGVPFIQVMEMAQKTVGVFEVLFIIECLMLLFVFWVVVPRCEALYKQYVLKRPLSPTCYFLKWVIVLLPICVLYGVAMFVIVEPEYVPSLASQKVESFWAFSKAVIRAMVSQSDELVQDYFYVKSYFMAYGWFDTTGPEWLYFVVRTLVQSACFIVWSSFVLRGSRKDFYALALILCFGVYVMLLTYANWLKGYTMPGRFAFPGLGILIVGMLIGISWAVSKEHYRKVMASLCFFTLSAFLLANLYGQQIIMVRRFLVGGL
jgi:hypothetical protein